MKHLSRRCTGRRLAVLAAALTALPCHADPDEAWLHRAELPADVAPLLVLLLDRSAATGEVATTDEDYDPARDYGAALPDASRCDLARIYLRRGPGPAPDCAQQAGVDIEPRSATSGLHCEAARAALAVSGFFVASRAAQWRATPGGGYWDAPRADGTEALECRADPDAPDVDWDRPPFADAHVFYAGNYLNYLRSTRAPVDRPVADVVAGRLSKALSATAGLDVALVLVDDDGPEGGFIARAPVPSAKAAGDVATLGAAPPAGEAPLAETLTEAAQWLAGGLRRFGTDDRTDPAALDPLAPASYRSPFLHACRPVSLAFVTAGAASGDEQAAAAAAALPRFAAETGGCGSDCLAAVADWLGVTDLRDDVPGTQSAPVSWVRAAPAPGAAALPDPLAFVNLMASAFQRDASIPGGAQLSAAALLPFDSTLGAPGVIYGVVAPRSRERWAGNLLRYALAAPSGPLEAPRVVDRDAAPAIDANGLPLPGARSLWSDAPDANLLAGGAAGRLPPAEARRIHADIASDRLLDAANRLVPGNTAISRAALGLGPGDAETADDLLALASTQRTLGDPGLQPPAVAEYPEAGLRVAFAATQDGLLHAFDAESGVELWAWMPKDMLPRLALLARDAPTTARSHGIDGPLLLHRHDPNGDGRVDAAAGEHLWLLFGLGRGGRRYYALDVALPRDPRLLWTLELPDQEVTSLAEAVVTRIAVAGSGQSAGEWVVLIAGGYDRQFDARGATGPGAGHRLMLVDAATGRLLWSAGGADSELAMPGLASLPSAPRAIDFDGDGELDRAYLFDVTGGLWRIDFETGRAAGELASARRLARLGDGGQRFQATPDASVQRVAGGNRIAIAVGSGWASRPRDATIEDRLYVIFDDAAGGPAPELTDADLHDVTDAAGGLPPDAPGWFLRLDAHGAGEKVVGPTATFDHVLRFQTYQPLPPDEAAPCGPPRSVARRYAIDLRTARPYATAVEWEDEEPEEIPAAGLPPGLRFGFPGRWEDACEGCRPRPFGIHGGETFDPGYAGDPVRTSWRKLAPPPALP